MKKFLPYALIVIFMGCLIIWAISQAKLPIIQPAQALGNAVTVVYTLLPTNTPMPTMTPYPTIDYRATDQAYQLAMEQERNRMIEVQLQHDADMLAQQVELARVYGTATAAGTQVAQINAQNTLTAGQLTLGAGMLTSTAQAPTQMAAIFKIQDDAKHYQEQRTKENVLFGVSVLFILSLTVLIIRKAFIINAAYIEKLEQESRKDAEARKPVEAPIVDYVIDDGINHRMERRFAQVLLSMRELEPNDAAVDMREEYWVEKGKRDKFQNRDEFLAVRDDWASDENAIIGRIDPTKTNSTFRVLKWDEVEEIANGSRM